MKVHVLNLLQKIPAVRKVNETLSLVPFVAFVEEKIRREDDVRTPFFEYVLKKIKDIPGWEKGMKYSDLDKYKGIFELIYFTFSPPMDSDNEAAWAMGEPLSLVLFFGTESFYRMLANKDGFLKGNPINGSNLPDIDKGRLRIIYSLVLKRLYNFKSPLKEEIIHSFKNEKTRLNKFFRIKFDTRFIDVTYDGELPTFDISNFNPNLYDEDDNLLKLQQLLPVEKFSFKGFSIVHVTDITPEYTIEYIKDTIVNLTPGQQVYTAITHSIKNLLGDNQIDIKLFPMLKVNDKLALKSLDDVGEHIKKQCQQYHFNQEEYLQSVAEFTQNPQLLFYPDLSVVKEDEDALIPLLRKSCLESLAIVPIFSKNHLVGILELFSSSVGGVDIRQLALITQVMPLLEQLLQSVVTYFDKKIDDIIREKFTSLQPSVQWRFNEAAWNYIQRRQRGESKEIEQVYFEDVYPLYGAIDVRNSTVQRNKALQNDMSYRLEMLIDLLKKTKEEVGMDLLDELIFKAEGWGEKIGDLISSEGENRLVSFFKNEAEATLQHIKQSGRGPVALIDQYFKAIQPDGKAYQNRVELEESMQQVNTTISDLLQKMNERIQDVYPCYFEKFRSDGMEYDIYIGQSITPQKKFDLLYLKNLRLLQLVSMVEITRATHALLPVMAKKLETTQLIFVHANTIDISFRSDERRFDVEGAYNIRYEIVKKRIDKACIKGTGERLTQPGKIALVYFRRKNVEEYESYVRFMQRKGYLEEEVEFLELEDLQGVQGLKALRLTVKMK